MFHVQIAFKWRKTEENFSDRKTKGMTQSQNNEKAEDSLAWISAAFSARQVTRGERPEGPNERWRGGGGWNSG